MKKNGIFLFLIMVCFNVFSQQDTIKPVLDSILIEADLMFRYEKAVWISSDILMTDETLKNNYGGYVVSHSGDNVRVTYIDEKQKESIARYDFVSTELSKPSKTSIQNSPLTKLEKELLDVKIKIINQLSDEKYEVTFPKDFNPNLVLIKGDNNYRLYIIMGTSESGVIPFGNDFLFITDNSGTITKSKKFHSRMIPAYSKGPNGEIVVSIVHSHLKTTPYITATDICTFRLYAEICGLEEFMILCPTTGKYFKYNINTNKISILDK